MAWFSYRQRKARNTESARIGYFIDCRFNRNRKQASLLFLDARTNEIFRWADTTGHKPYLLTDASIEEAEKLLGDFEYYAGCETIKKQDVINNRFVELTKVYSTNPGVIGSSAGRASFRTVLENAGYNVWEGDKLYKYCYAYDNSMIFWMPYWVSKNSVKPYVSPRTLRRIEEVDRAIFSNIERNRMIEFFIELFETDVPDVRVCALDIEVEPNEKNQVPDAEAPNERVICVSFAFDDGRKIIYYLEREEIEEKPFTIDGAVVKKFKKEETLLKECFALIRTVPIVLTFNGDSFDLKYLANRAYMLGFKRFDVPLWTKRNISETDVTTGIHIDLYRFFKKNSIKNYAFKGKYNRFGLNDISNALLGKTKIEHETPIRYMEYEDLCRYCLQDSLLTLELATFNNRVVLNLLIALARISNIPIEKICRTQISTWIKGLIQNWLCKHNILVPRPEEVRNRSTITTTATIKGKQYEGAYVMKPKSGVYFDVVVVDFSSLYPSEIQERNICFTTVDCEHEECKSNIVPGTGHHICTKRKGILSDVCGGLKDLRIYWYKKQSREYPDEKTRSVYLVFSEAIKVFINAMYGVFAAEAFGMYSPGIAECVAAFGRYDINRIIEKSRELGMEPIYCDTDSLFVYKPDRSKLEELKKWSVDILKLKLSEDYVFKYVCFSHRKKNYVGITVDGKIIIKGLTGKKSHTPEMFKRKFNEVLSILKNEIDTPEDFEEAKDKIISIVEDGYNDIVSKNVEPEDLAVKMVLGKPIDEYLVNSQIVKAAKILVENGYEVSAGDVISFVKANNEQGVIPLQLADKSSINVKSYCKDYKSMMVQILEPLGIEFDYDILKKVRQQKIADFI